MKSNSRLLALAALVLLTESPQRQPIRSHPLQSAPKLSSTLSIFPNDRKRCGN